MQLSRWSFVAVFSITTAFPGSPGARPCLAQASAVLTGEQRQALADAQHDLQTTLDEQHDAEDWVDAAVWQKGLAWALNYDNEFTPADVKLLQRSVERCRERLAALADDRRPWTARRGKTVLGYVSRVDGSVQPYGVVVPQAYDPATPIRLDVVLHGSTRPVGMSELRFMARFDEGDGPDAEPPDQPFIELHPLGRVENCYRWAGETDVFEAIDDVCRRYAIDRDRIVLRGMSMGASGTWHLGLKHPDQFVALGPYCGYVDTHHFSETPLPNFVTVGPLPEWQETGLHLLDSIDYAANAGVVPVVACIGEKDVFFQAHVLMGEAMQREGLTLVNLISPGTGHVIDPVTHAEQMRRIAVYADKGINHTPRDLRFVTWTLKYSRCHWLQLLGLERHYARAEITGHLRDDVVEIEEPRNVTSFAVIGLHPATIRVGQVELAVPESLRSAENSRTVLQRDGNGWRIATGAEAEQAGRKRPGLQGPIDDAFTSPFLCVRGTGQPWNPAIDAYADAALKRFADEWEHYFRGVLPVKDDTAVTHDDLRTRNLILFGDPGSNPWIAQALPRLPVTWTRESLRVGSDEYTAREHFPALIAPSPFAGGADRYIVLNSGHTFREAELASLNYLLFPRWGDWAVLRIDPERAPSVPAEETVVRAGFFDEEWMVRD
jgi:Prolyl oligopeptidase family